MPNWMLNKLVFIGEYANAIVSKFLTHEEDEISVTYDKDVTKGRFDFNKIIPMPESLNTVCGSITMPACDYYLSSVNPDCPEVEGKKMSVTKFKELLKKIQEYDKSCTGKNSFVITDKHYEIVGGTRKDFLAYGKTIATNIEKYGVPTWYEFACKKWGVKWNASDTRIDAYPEQVEVIFETAWNRPLPVIEKLIYLCAELDVTIKYDWSEEQTGYIDGYLIAKNGEILEDVDYPSGSKKAKKHWSEMWGYDD